VKRLAYILPLAVFAVLFVYFALGLRLDPRLIPSALIDKPVPTFDLPPIEGGQGSGFSSADLTGRVSAVNVFASWCLPCRAEHPLVTRLGKIKGVALYGINYKDKPADALAWLEELGNPFLEIGADSKGRLAIDWGVYGLPETFIIDKKGRIRYKHVGPMTPQIFKDRILPVIEELLG
jgi:cytochrome c biogenesis protein CcmG/thiol:disulfide interchange protein DsbE